ncbi:centrosomal protein of 89 kDa-like [Macrosteles quadrilineatus]|uniref:centrosomal protein of 89 kDa-like n=1 Tax=Macrosteles quadrilineatus TaxID=74068 RepID=UPI0023E23910|nr:centrosomal protein of 89 kDa-like [Macrosteles quadrilineatus]
MALSRSRPTVPELPLFSTIVTDLPIDETSSTGINSSLATDFGSSQRHQRHSRRNKKNLVHQRSLSEANLYHHEQASMSPDVSERGKCRHRQSKRHLVAEIERLKRENQHLLNTGYGSGEVKLRALEGRIVELHSSKQKLEQERETLSRRINEDSETIDKLRVRSKELAQDVFMLKNLVMRMNTELAKAQNKLSQKGEPVTTASEDSGVEHRSQSDSRSSWKPTWSRAEMNAMAPLLEAFEETLAEKEELISNYKREMQLFTNRTKEIVSENESLHAQLVEANKKGEVTYAEWKVLTKEAAMTREQNELLLRQTKLNQSKLNELHTAYQTRLTELTLDLEQAEERCQQARTEVFVLKGRLGVLTDELERLKNEADNRIPVAVHTASVNECKRLFEELKNRYEQERDILTRKLATLESLRPDLDIQLVTVSAERDQLNHEIRNLQKQLKKAEGRAETSDARVRKCERVRATLKQQLEQALAFSRELICDQETLLRQLADRTHETNQVVRHGHDNASRMDTLRTKLKGLERGAKVQLDVLEQRMKAQEAGMNKAKANWAKEMGRLKTVIKEKDAAIEQLQKEKIKSKEEVELVWEAATADNQRVKESIRIAELLPSDDG